MGGQPNGPRCLGLARPLAVDGMRLSPVVSIFLAALKPRGASLSTHSRSPSGPSVSPGPTTGLRGSNRAEGMWPSQRDFVSRSAKEPWTFTTPGDYDCLIKHDLMSGSPEGPLIPAPS